MKTRSGRERSARLLGSPSFYTKRLRSAGMTRSCALLSAPASSPRTIATGARSSFPITTGRAGDLVRDRDDGRGPARSRSDRARPQVQQDVQAGGTDGDVGVPRRHGRRRNRSRRRRRRGRSASPRRDPQALRGGVGVDGEEDDRAGLGRVRGVDAARGADDAVVHLGDEERAPGADEAPRFPEDPRCGAGLHLRPARAPAPWRRARRRPAARSGPRSSDRLLRDDEDVPVHVARLARR